MGGRERCHRSAEENAGAWRRKSNSSLRGFFLSWGAENERKLREGECGWGQSVVAEGLRSALRAFCVEWESLGLGGKVLV